MISMRRAIVASHTFVSRPAVTCTGLVVVALLAVWQGASTAVAAAPLSAAAQSAPANPAQRTDAVLVTTREGISEVSMTAQGARLADVAADLSRRLNTRIIVGPSMANEMIWVKFSESPLEAALSSLAPRVYVDYEIRQGAPPAPLAIYLLGSFDPEPAINAVVRGASQGLLITGNTEDTTTASLDDPLQVSGDRNRLTIKSKQQPLATVVTAVADVLGVPVDINAGGAEIVDVDIKAAPAEDALRLLSPSLRLYVRVDVNLFERKLLRLVVAPPAAR